MSEPIPFRIVSDRPRYRVRYFDQIRPSSSTYLTKGLYPRRGLAFISGQSKAGKTFVVLDHTLKIACGATVMARRTKHMGVVYIAAEDPEGCAARIEAWKKRYPRDLGRYTPFAMFDGPVDLNDPDATADLRDFIRDAVAEFKANGFDLGAVVFDTLAQCVPGSDENSSSDMGNALKAIQAVSRDFDCLSMVVAHHGKNDSLGIRGWSGLIGAADAIVSVKRDEVNPDYRTITLDKVKNGKDGEVIAFSLKAAPIGLIDEDGDEVWSCTVNYDGSADQVPKPTRRVALRPDDEIMLTAIRWVTDNGATQDPPASALGVRQGTKAVRRTDVYARAETLGFADEGESEAAFMKRRSRALKSLATKARTRMEGDLVWLL